MEKNGTANINVLKEIIQKTYVHMKQKMIHIVKSQMNGKTKIRKKNLYFENEEEFQILVVAIIGTSKLQTLKLN